MINLLPELYKKAFITEYRFRIGVAIAGFIAIITIIGAVLLIPGYIVSVNQKATLEDAQPANTSHSATTISPTAALHQTLLAQTATLSATLSALSSSAGTPAVLFTDIMPSVLTAKPSGVSIVSVNYTAGDSLELNGTAATRDILAAFTTALKNQADISSVDVPISDFAGDTDIKFDMTIVPTGATHA